MSTEAVRTNKEIIDRVEQVLQGAYNEYTDFNTALDAGGDLEVTSVNPANPRYKLLPSEAMFWADRKAYFDDLLFWENSSMDDRHRDAVDYLRAEGLLADFVNLAAAIPRNRVAPFVGAGMSAFKFPTWGAALVSMEAKAGGHDKAKFDAAMAAYDYLEAAQILWDADQVTVENEVRTVFAKSHIPAPPLPSPIRLLPKISKGCVITTNFDAVIEAALVGETLDGYMHGVQAAHNFTSKLLKGDRCIMKLHGDAENPASYIFTKAQYLDGYSDPFDFRKPLPNALRQIYLSHSLLFLGCGLEQDRTMDLFQHVRDHSGFTVPDHYAILPKPAPAAFHAKKTRLLRLNIHPIWYPDGRREFVEHYLNLAIDLAEGRYKL
jgi:hypothetical protein